VFLIVENLSVHVSQTVNAWLADKKDRIEVFTLPKYAPERNPDEYLNCDVKGNINDDGLPNSREELHAELALLAFERGDYERAEIFYKSTVQATEHALGP